MLLKLLLNFALILVLLLNGPISWSRAKRISYKSYRVYSVTPSTDKEFDLLNSLRLNSDAFIFLDDILNKGDEANIAVAPHKVPDFVELMNRNALNYELREWNLQSVLANDEVQRVTEYANGYNWTAYHPWQDTYAWVLYFKKKYPRFVSVIKLGQSYERRDIFAVKVSFSRLISTNKPRAILLEAGAHGNEWIGPAIATYIINKLVLAALPAVPLMGQAMERGIAKNLLEYEWYIVPHLNPDGYEYTRSTDPLWRKTRSVHGSCFGVDLNRNWGYIWDDLPDTNPCSHYHPGSGPFSEVETRSMANFTMSLRNKLHLYISLHGSSNLLLYPAVAPDDVPAYVKIFNVTANALRNVYGTEYRAKDLTQNCLEDVGSSLGWVYKNPKTNAKMAFGYELGLSQHFSGVTRKPGMQLPASQIEAIGNEVITSLIAMVKEVKAIK